MIFRPANLKQDYYFVLLLWEILLTIAIRFICKANAVHLYVFPIIQGAKKGWQFNETGGFANFALYQLMKWKPAF